MNLRSTGWVCRFAWVLIGILYCLQSGYSADTNAILSGTNSLSTTSNFILNSENTKPEFDPVESFFRVLSGLVIVILIFLGGVWLYKNRLTQPGAHALNGQLKVLESKFLGNKQGIVVIAYGNKRMMLGTTHGSMSKISDLPDLTDEEISKVYSQNQGQQGSQSGFSFAQILAKASNHQIKGNRDGDSNPQK